MDHIVYVCSEQCAHIWLFPFNSHWAGSKWHRHAQRICTHCAVCFVRNDWFYPVEFRKSVSIEQRIYDSNLCWSFPNWKRSIRYTCTTQFMKNSLFYLSVEFKMFQSMQSSWMHVWLGVNWIYSVWNPIYKYWLCLRATVLPDTKTTKTNPGSEWTFEKFNSQSISITNVFIHFFLQI